MTASSNGDQIGEEDRRLAFISAAPPRLNNATAVEHSISELLRVVRELLDLEVVFVGEFLEGRRVFRHISAARNFAIIKLGESHPLDLTLCSRIAEGRFPAVAHEVSALIDMYGLSPALKGMGGHIGVPVRYDDGTLYGMLCGFSTEACPHLGGRDLKRLEIAAQTTARLLAQAAGHDVTMWRSCAA